MERASSMKLGKLLHLLFLVASVLVLLCSNAALANEGAEVEVEKMDEKDAYAVLGLGKRATEAEIRKAFKDKSLILHPDKEEGSEQDFAELRLAYETLIDYDRRLVLDELDGKGFDHPDEFEVVDDGTELSDFYKESRQIVTFNNENILSFLWRKQAWIVEFYVPWCSYCQTMAPKYKLLTTKYASAEYVRFGAVNCMKSKAMCDRYPFQLVPTFMCFHSDKDYHMYEGIPDEEKIDAFIQKCEDDYQVHLDNGDPVFDKFMMSGGAEEKDVDLDADDYDYDLSSDDGDDGEAAAAAVPPPVKAKKAVVVEEDEDALFDEDDYIFGDNADQFNGGGAESDNEDYDYELVSGDDEVDSSQGEADAVEKTAQAGSSGDVLEEENQKLRSDLQEMKQRMKDMEEHMKAMKGIISNF